MACAAGESNWVIRAERRNVRRSACRNRAHVVNSPKIRGSDSECWRRRTVEWQAELDTLAVMRDEWSHLQRVDNSHLASVVHLSVSPVYSYVARRRLSSSVRPAVRRRRVVADVADLMQDAYFCRHTTTRKDVGAECRHVCDRPFSCRAPQALKLALSAEFPIVSIKYI